MGANKIAGQRQMEGRVNASSPGCVWRFQRMDPKWTCRGFHDRGNL